VGPTRSESGTAVRAKNAAFIPRTDRCSLTSVKIVHEYTGRGPTKARTTLRDHVVVVMLQETLLKAEHSLIRDGKAELVIEMRRSFQQTMREAMSAAVTQATGREVIAFMSDSHLEPDYSTELFVLAPEDRVKGSPKPRTRTTVPRTASSVIMLGGRPDSTEARAKGSARMASVACPVRLHRCPAIRASCNSRRCRGPGPSVGDSRVRGRPP
jgi:uncharacterized protein YbcI